MVLKERNSFFPAVIKSRVYNLKLHLSKNTILFVVIIKAILWNSKATSEMFEYLDYFLNQN